MSPARLRIDLRDVAPATSETWCIIDMLKLVLLVNDIDTCRYSQICNILVFAGGRIRGTGENVHFLNMLIVM